MSETLPLTPDAQFHLSRLPDGRWRAHAPGVTITASTFEEAVERARMPFPAPQDALQGGCAAEAIPTPEEAKSRLDALLASPAGQLIARPLGLPDELQDTLHASVAGGGCVDALEARSGRKTGLAAVSGFWVGLTHDQRERARDALMSLAAARYRAALARGVWWG